MRQALDIIWRRAVFLVPVALVSTFISFMLVNFQQGNTALTILGTSATPTNIKEFNLKYGLDHGLFYRYFSWLWGALHGHLGYSYVTGQTVSSEITQRIPIDFELVLLALFIALLFAIPSSILSVRRPMGIADWTARGVSMVGLSAPSFVVGPLLVLVLAVDLKWLPFGSFVPLSQGIYGNFQTIILPAVSLGFAFYASYSRILRGDMIDQLVGEEYVHTARSKGLSEGRILIGHVFKNSLFSLVTVIGTNIGVILGGAVVVETLFNLDGMGQLLQSSVLQKDAPVVQGLVAVVCVTVVVGNLLADIAYMILDPRVRYGTAR
jgi:peptide/nickel transport system permease protein